MSSSARKPIGHGSFLGWCYCGNHSPRALLAVGRLSINCWGNWSHSCLSVAPHVVDASFAHSVVTVFHGTGNRHVGLRLKHCAHFLLLYSFCLENSWRGLVDRWFSLCRISYGRTSKTLRGPQAWWFRWSDVSLSSSVLLAMDVVQLWKGMFIVCVRFLSIEKSVSMSPQLHTSGTCSLYTIRSCIMICEGVGPRRGTSLDWSCLFMISPRLFSSVDILSCRPFLFSWITLHLVYMAIRDRSFIQSLASAFQNFVEVACTTFNVCVFR